MAGERARPDQQVTLVHDHHAGTDPGFIGHACSPFVDALDLRGMHGVPLVPVFELLAAIPFGTRQNCTKPL